LNAWYVAQNFALHVVVSLFFLPKVLVFYGKIEMSHFLKKNIMGTKLEGLLWGLFWVVKHLEVALMMMMMMQ
jgi:hypothetical protein